MEGVNRELIVLCFNKETLKRFQGPITSIAQDRTVKILFPKGVAEGIVPLKVSGTMKPERSRNFLG